MTKPKAKFTTSEELEIAVALWFDNRKNIIVPNISWSMFNYEWDLCVLNPQNWASEVEIKVSRSDLKADAKKTHKHNSRLARYLWFAITEKMGDCTDMIPARAGILVVTEQGVVIHRRSASANPLAIQFDARQRANLGRLGTLRMWNMKQALLNLQEKYDELRKNAEYDSERVRTFRG